MGDGFPGNGRSTSPQVLSFPCRGRLVPLLHRPPCGALCNLAGARAGARGRERGGGWERGRGERPGVLGCAMRVEGQLLHGLGEVFLKDYGTFRRNYSVAWLCWLLWLSRGWKCLASFPQLSRRFILVVDDNDLVFCWWRQSSGL